jgi:hypothetical protein
MTRGIVVTGIVTLALDTGSGSSRSQERVVVAPPPRAMRREPVREVIVVERTHVPRGHAYGWWKKHGYSEVTVYYDGTRYYSREGAPTGFRAVIVYQREGKYYLPDEDGEGSRSHHGHGRNRED